MFFPPLARAALPIFLWIHSTSAGFLVTDPQQPDLTTTYSQGETIPITWEAFPNDYAASTKVVDLWLTGWAFTNFTRLLQSNVNPNVSSGCGVTFDVPNDAIAIDSTFCFRFKIPTNPPVYVDDSPAWGTSRGFHLVTTAARSTSTSMSAATIAYSATTVREVATVPTPFVSSTTSTSSYSTLANATLSATNTIISTTASRITTITTSTLSEVPAAGLPSAPYNKVAIGIGVSLGVLATSLAIFILILLRNRAIKSSDIKTQGRDDSDDGNCEPGVPEDAEFELDARGPEPELDSAGARIGLDPDTAVVHELHA